MSKLLSRRFVGALVCWGLTGCRNDPPISDRVSTQAPPAAAAGQGPGDDGLLDDTADADSGSQLVGSGPGPARVPRAPPAGVASPIESEASWVRCHRAFRVSGEPRRDVLKLGIMCGPSNGMLASGPIHQAELAAETSEHELTHELKRGDCIRVLAAAEPQIQDLELEAIDPAGAQLALSNVDRSWGVLKADGPLCIDTTGTYTIRLRAHGGTGRFALQLFKSIRFGD